jgi:hypothetical protein
MRTHVLKNREREHARQQQNCTYSSYHHVGRENAEATKNEKNKDPS